MPQSSWVIGAGGLLGSAVTRQLREQGRVMFAAPSISWETEGATADLAAGLSAFWNAVAADDWQIYWCAGSGVTNSAAPAFARELAIFTSFLSSIEATLPGDAAGRGGVFLASSAGAVYAGSKDAPFHEASETAPLGLYGESKLAIEGALADFSRATGVRSIVGRISNLYGPGQDLRKAQGLISRLCLTSLTREPLSVFVSFDTLRDYLYVDDCAALVVAASDRLRLETSAQPSHIKVLASGRSVTIGELVNEFRHVARNRPQIVIGSTPQSLLQSRDLRMRSRYWPELDERPTVNLADGIARTLQDIRRSFLLAPGGERRRAIS